VPATFCAVEISRAQSRATARKIISLNPRFEIVIERSGFCTIGVREKSSRVRESNFSSLASSIISQQLSTKVAATIIKRVEALCGGALKAEQIAELRKAELRSAGCSESKARAIRQLAHASIEGTIPMKSLHRFADEEIMKYLLPQFGIGRWTVEMFLMFQLGRQDVWPVGDLGVRRGWERIHNLRNEIEPKKLEKLGARFSPYRSHVAWYCWRANEVL
jgi:DNA-3-methyladenine glycosylase II